MQHRFLQHLLKRQRTYFIAEMSCNHNQDFERAEDIVRAAKESGADALKVQTFTADTITSSSASKEYTIKGTIWEGKNLHSLYQRAYMPWEWHPRLKALANELGMDFFSSPFDVSAVDFLEEINVPAYKVASFEIVDIPLLKKIATTAKPVIVSTGMATLSEIDEAVRTLRENGCPGLALLKCTSAYPAPVEEANLKTIPHMAEAFGVPVGLSDHTLGIAVPIAAVVLGATIIEKHITLSREFPTLDSAFSLEPYEFRAMVDAVRDAEKALGRVAYEVTGSEEDSRMFRRSLFVIQDMKRGEMLTEENLRSIRPGNGLPPKFYDILLGCKINRDIKKGSPLTWNTVL